MQTDREAERERERERESGRQREFEKKGELERGVFLGSERSVSDDGLWRHRQVRRSVDSPVGDPAGAGAETPGLGWKNTRLI